MIKMNLKFYFSVLNLWSLKYVLTTYCTSYDFELYLFEVVKHILYHHQLQETLNLWHNKNITDDSIKLLNISLDNIDINAQIFNSIVISMNCRYAKLLQIYDSYIKAMIGECENYYNKKLFDKFIECTKLVQDVVCNSSGMFENFYDILTFIINLDVKFIFDEYVTPITIINEIHTIYTYNSSKKKPCMFTYIKSNGHFDTDEACKDLLNIKHFHATVTDMLHNLQFLDTASNLTSNSIHKYLLEKYNDKYALQKEKDKSYVQFIYDDLIMCYNEAIKYDNDNLGYQELFHPTVPGLVPPVSVFDTEHRIASLNKLFSKRYLEPFTNIKIVLENSTKLDASTLFQTKLNYRNLGQNEKYFEQLLRCRYAEILIKYERLLAYIINLCKNEVLKSIINICNKQYVECIHQLRNSVSLSVNMLKSLLSALAILKKSSIWEYSKNVHNCLHIPATIITELFYDLKALNMGPYENTKTMNEIQAKAYLNQLCNTHEKLKNGLRSEMGGLFKCRCEFLEKYGNAKTLRVYFNNLKESTKYDGPVYELICSHINIYCNQIIDTDYENLGFKDLI
ncbi:uncharacterized protein LOC126900031 isoform X2 [Daktulosphaira vitifoliae]|uniref:uncharacterized protein LOC126900031 isoform X2 n=1 Tax=Daktulosphaira vitifoliae TaxID=58002 RepID=UPI0021A9901C|nr:uncharacterized protein LOC126900031 isoform X2 [Daktulosphaira vitifoliae]